ncbi:MAG: PIN domain-containing protein [Candidatus Bathyarchaeia archaeon]
MRRVVIVDSNFLFLPTEFKVDVIGQIEEVLSRRVRLVLPRPAYDEVRKRASLGSPKERRQALMAMELGRKWSDILDVELKPGETVDELIQRLAVELHGIVATNDKELRRELRGKGIPVIFLKQRSHLVVDGATEI